MKCKFLLSMLPLFCTGIVSAQWATNNVWTCSFGSRTTAIEYTNSSSANPARWSNPKIGGNLFDVVAPTSGASLGLAIHHQANSGKITLNTDNSLTLLMGQASQYVRFSTTNIQNVGQGGPATSVVRHSFTVKVGNSNVGNLVFGLGTSMATESTLFRYDGGNLFSKNNSIFGAIRLVYGASGSNGVALTYREASSKTNAAVTGGASAFQKEGIYNIQVYANNSGETIAKTYTGPDATPGTIADGALHVWVSDASVTPAVWTKFTIAKSTDDGIPVKAPLNAFTFQVFGDATATVGAEFTISNIELSFAADAATLPVALTSFTATNQGSGVKLTWHTASEQNNAHFEVERSADGVTFSKIGTIVGAGTSNTENKYILTDASPLAGTSYYRLKQVDLNGNFAYVGDVIGVKSNLILDTYKVSVANGNSLRGFVVVDKKATASFTLFDVYGKAVLKSKVLLESGSNRFTQDVSKFPSGIYVAALNVGGQELIQKIAK